MSDRDFGHFARGVTQLKPSDLKPAQARTTQWVHCPYCVVGEVPLVVKRDRDGNMQADLKPVQCPQCSNYFRFGWRIQFVGIQMGD